MKQIYLLETYKVLWQLVCSVHSTTRVYETNATRVKMSNKLWLPWIVSYFQYFNMNYFFYNPGVNDSVTSLSNIEIPKKCISILSQVYQTLNYLLSYDYIYIKYLDTINISKKNHLRKILILIGCVFPVYRLSGTHVYWHFQQFSAL